MLNKINKYIKEHWDKIIFLGLAGVFFLISFQDLRIKLIDNPEAKKISFIFIITSIIVLFIILSLIIYNNKKFNDKRIPRIFLITSLIIGFIYIFSSPLFTGSDEHNHYYRIYEITEGTFVTPTNEFVGGYLPESLKKTFEIGSGNNTNIKYSNIPAMMGTKLDKSNTIQYGTEWTSAYNNTALYSPPQYLPQIIGFMIGKTLNLGPYYIGILGRIFNLLFYALLGYASLRIMPKNKLFYLVILMSPNMIQCATTLSADAFTNIIFLFLISMILKIHFKNEQLSSYHKIIILITSLLISLCKIVYVPIIFLLLIIDSKKFKYGKKEKTIFSIITITLSIVVSLLWMKQTDLIFKVAYDQTELQKNFILTNIFSYITIFIRTLTIYIIKYIECLFVGTTMYHSQLKMPAFISFLYIIIVVLSLITQKTKENLTKKEKILTGLIAICITGLICTAIYIQCTAQYYSIGHLTIEGIQGRYFIPIVIMIPFLLNFNNIKNFKQFKEKNLVTLVLVINLITIFYMMSNFLI